MRDRRSLTRHFAAVCLTGLATMGGPSLPVSPASAQDPDNEAIAAAKNAALVIEGQGNTPVKPNGYYVRVEMSAEGRDRATVTADCRKYRDDVTKALESLGIRISAPAYYALLRRTQSSYQGLMSGVPYEDLAAANSPSPALAPGEALRAVTQIAFGAENPAKLRQAFAAMRGTGAAGMVTVDYSADEKAARLPALKAALLDAQQRVKVLGEAAKPKVLDLVFIREGEFRLQNPTSRAALQGGDGLVVYDRIDATASVTFFYGLKTGPQAAPAKTVKPTKAPAKTVQTTPKKP